jgi:hypothetical protein
MFISHIHFSNRATIKIPINKLKRDIYDTDKKSAAEVAIEAEVARRRERNVGFEDVTDVSREQFTMDLPML